MRFLDSLKRVGAPARVKFLRLVVCWVLVCGPLAWAAGSSPDELASSLKGKVVFLRGMEAGDKLSFDAQGKAVGDEEPGAFAYSAVEISEVHLSETALEFTGNRDALMFGTKSKTPSTDDIRFVARLEPISIEIARDAAHPEALDAAIHSILALSAVDVLKGRPANEIQSDLETIGSIAPVDGWPSVSDKKAGIYHPGWGGVAQPHVLRAVSPAGEQGAVDPHKRPKFEGICILNLIVDESGRPIHIRVARSLNQELDISAVEAMCQYQFAPSTVKGKPVSVRLAIEISFRIY